MGTVQFGMDYGVQGFKKTDQNDVYKILEYAIENGVTTFDTASIYGGAEKILGDFISASKEVSIKVITKLNGTCLQGVKRKEYKNVIFKEVSKSCTTLNLNKLDGYLLHNTNHLYECEILAALSELKKDGYINHVGVSVYSPEEALGAANNAAIDYIQVPYNALDHRLEKNRFFEKAAKNGKTVFVRSVFLQGLLMMRPETIPHYITSAQNSVEHFQKICGEEGYDSIEGSLAYVKNNKKIDYLIFGVNTLDQTKEIVEKYDNIDSISESFVAKIRKTFNGMDEKIVNPALWNKR